MALVPCPECQREVSTEARVCPQCAYPFPGKSAGQERRQGGRQQSCPQCHGPVSPHLQACPHCGVALIRKPAPIFSRRRESTGATPSLLKGGVREDPERWGRHSREIAAQDSRRRLPLWQEPSPVKGAPPAHHRRSPANSLIVGLILVAIVAISVVFGAIWQLEGLNPLEAILQWRLGISLTLPGL